MWNFQEFIVGNKHYISWISVKIEKYHNKNQASQSLNILWLSRISITWTCSRLPDYFFDYWRLIIVNFEKSKTLLSGFSEPVLFQSHKNASFRSIWIFAEQKYEKIHHFWQDRLRHIHIQVVFRFARTSRNLLRFLRLLELFL